MKIVFYAADKHREGVLATAFKAGAEGHGEQVEIELTTHYSMPRSDTDVAVMIGVKGKSRLIIDDHRAMGKSIIYIDKGYFRIPNTYPDRLSRSLYYKTSINDFQPLEYLMRRPMPGDRWEELQCRHHLEVKPWREEGERIVWLGPSQKYCNFHRLGDATEFSEKTIKLIAKRTTKKVVYRPKHSWADAVPIKGTEFSRPPTKIEDEFKTAYALATHGSNTSAEAILAGVPVLALGPAIARPLAETDIKKISNIRVPTDEERLQWLHNIAYCQWTVEEFTSGLAWSHLKKRLPK